MSDKFNGRYYVRDGYVGDNPKYISVSSNILEDDMTDDELMALYQETAQEHFEQNVYPEIDKKDDFLKWAREQLAKRKSEE